MSTAVISCARNFDPESRTESRRPRTMNGRGTVSVGTIMFPPFRLDIANQCLWRQPEAGEDERILLTPKAFAVLRYLVERAGRLVTQEELLEAVWPDTFIQPEVLKYQIADIRGALGDRAKAPRFIETLPRRGYQFIATVKETECTHVEPPAASPVEDSLEAGSRELKVLRDSLQEMLCGDRQVVFITGEPRIGKAALVGAAWDRMLPEIREALDTLTSTAPILLVLRVG